jgi:release factor glutamine methyltransferase
VFIPRPETEHVVEVVLDIVRNRLSKPTARIVDVGTGSGCIALALASELPQAEIFATEISTQALTVARHNAEILGFADRVQFLESDLLEVFLTGHRTPVTGHRLHFDLVVSNPPYVSEDESAQLPREVREHEPAAALFSPDEGLAVTRRLIDQAALLLGRVDTEALQIRNLESRVADDEPRVTSSQPAGGWLVLELGYHMAGRVRALLGEAWTNIETTDDLRGIPRVLAAQKR